MEKASCFIQAFWTAKSRWRVLCHQLLVVRHVRDSFENISETRPGKPMIGAMLAPGTMGISYDPNHPVFRYFPGEGHSDYQWFNVIMNGNPVILDHFAEPVEPIVWTIDTPHRCHRLGLLFELKSRKRKSHGVYHRPVPVCRRSRRGIS